MRDSPGGFLGLGAVEGCGVLSCANQFWVVQEPFLTTVEAATPRGIPRVGFLGLRAVAGEMGRGAAVEALSRSVKRPLQKTQGVLDGLLGGNCGHGGM